jgi:hypothetical protein
VGVDLIFYVFVFIFTDLFFSRICGSLCVLKDESATSSLLKSLGNMSSFMATSSLTALNRALGESQ